MESGQLLNLIYGVAMIALGGLALWFRGSSVVKGMVAALIAEAEAMYQDAAKAGGLKFEWVVSKLCARLPFLSGKAAGTLVQAVFDSVEAYAKIQLDRAAEQAAGRLRDDQGD